MNARTKTASNRGVAIVIVLAVIVLLAGMVMAFFSRVSNERTVASSDAGTLKADLLARSAMGLIVSDLKQEIIVTSSATTVGSGTNTTTIYTPNTAAAMMPARTGTLTSIPNLIRESLRSDGLSVSSSASAVNSATDVSANGRSVSLARWNAHYLIPRLDTTSTTIDTTPIADCSAPDWVFVNRNGRVVLSAPSSTISDASATNQNFVVGRYAYAIYDEGGLLDINVAGSPSTTTGSAADIGRKGSAALADLTQLPTETGTLAQSVVDQLIGWRNYATIQPSGLYPNFSLDASAASRYLNYVTGNTNGFLTISGTTYNSRTDQAMMTRQQLIALGRSIGMSQNVYQYLGTFSRDLEQPSYFPNPNRPKVQSSGTASNGNINIFGTGNDAYGNDRNSTASTDINPPILNVRVVNSFTRPDGTTAKAGDPLISKRFPLSRLALLISNATASKSQSDAIYRNFGLYRSDASKPWQYDHGNGTGILRLSDVAALSPGREPDFFELLKAAINVGSLGKGSAYDFSNSSASNYLTPGTSGYLQQAKDTLTQLQLLQIGANIIDQAKSDNYPTRIQFAGDTTTPKNEVRGIQDLPYILGFRNWITQYIGTSGTMAAMWMQPELWNPHAPRGVNETSPTTFRVRVEPDPSSMATTPPIIALSAYYAYTGTDKKLNYDVVDVSGTVTLNGTNFSSASNSAPNPQPLVFNSGSAAGYWDFREPTLLGVSNMPATAHMDSSAFSNTVFKDIITNTPDTGVLLATLPWCYYITIASGSNTGTLPRTDYLYKVNINSPSSNYACSTRIYLDYKDTSNNWITYDDQVFEYQQGAASLDVHVIGSHKTYADKVTNANEDWCGAMRADPRTSRWAAQYYEYAYLRPFLDASNNTWGSMRPDGGLSQGCHLGKACDLGWNIYGSYKNTSKQCHGNQLGYVQENSTRLTYQTDDTNYYRYVRDPDGVVRRGVSGYITDTTNGGTTPSASLPVTGLPMAQGNYSARPTLLHRPFRSVAELGYVFRDTPWANLNFSFPESGDSALLDIFCINENTDSNSLVAGRVNLNTRQAPVLQALIANALRDKDDAANPLLSGTVAAEIAAKLVSRTTNNAPLLNRADLVGRWVYSGASPAAAKTALSGTDPTSTTTGPNPDNYHTGFSYDIGAVPSVINNANNLAVSLIPRQREAVIRALADAGNARTWNLLVDVVAQSGRFPANSSSLSNFVVDGEKRYWLHVAIDRYTGTVLDSQLEVVK